MKLEAAIEIGSTGIRLLVAEEIGNGKRNILDRSEKPIPSQYCPADAEKGR